MKSDGTLQVFSIFDVKAQFYMSPFMCRNSAEAIRGFSDAINQDQTDPRTGQSFKTPLQLHPEDYSLFHLGSFNELTGQYSNLQAPLSLGSGHEFVNMRSPSGPAVSLVKGDNSFVVNSDGSMKG